MRASKFFNLNICIAKSSTKVWVRYFHNDMIEKPKSKTLHLNFWHPAVQSCQFCMEFFDILFRFYWYSSKNCNVTISTRYKRFYPEKCWGWKWCNCCTLHLSGCSHQAELRWRKLPCDLLRKAQENWGNIGKTNIPIYKVIFQLFAQFENRRDVKNIFGKNRGPPAVWLTCPD